MKVVVITGGSSGIGLATAKLFAKNNHIVYSISRRKFDHPKINHLVGDVTDFVSMKECIAKIYKNEGKIDILINNAGMGIAGAIEETSEEDASHIINVNLLGVFNSSKAVLPFMRTQRSGRIINISSAAAVFPIPFQAFYSATKSAIKIFGSALQIEVAPFGIKVCTFLPGDIKTEFTENRRITANQDSEYFERLKSSLAVMEKDEQTGMTSTYAAQIIYKTCLKRRLPLTKTIGFKYKIFVFLNKLLPTWIVNKVISSIYGFIPKNK